MALIDLLGKIDTLKKELDGLKPVSPEREKLLWKKFHLEWNYNSNHIEGNTLTYSETQLFFLHGKTTGDHDIREYDEMRAHDAAIQLIRNWAEEKERELTETDIRNLNKVILKEPFWKEARTRDGQTTMRLIKVGEYKEHPNSVMLSSGKMFEYASPEETPRMMTELVDWYRASEIKNAILLAAELHYRYIRIHPFDDGNGRIARLLVNYVLLKNDFPPVIIKSAEKDKYLTALRKADAGDRESFHEYMTEQLIWSLEIAIKAAKGESIEEQEDIDKEIALLEKDLSSVDPQKTIQTQFNKKVLLDVSFGWGKQLLIEGIKATQKFNRFFTGTNHSVHFGSVGIHRNFIDDAPEDIMNDLLEKLIKATDKQSDVYGVEIRLQTFFGSFKSAGLNTFGCNYSIKLKFETIKYEVYIDQFDPDAKHSEIKVYERLLHQPITENEINEIIKKFSKTILAHIDYCTKQNGLR